MLVVRNTFHAKPGMAGKLAAQIKAFGKAAKMKKMRVMTDAVTDFNTVVLEHEVESLAAFEEFYARAAENPAVVAKMKGYTDFWTSGKREFFRIV